MAGPSRMGSLPHSRVHDLMRLKARSVLESATQTFDPRAAAGTIQQRAASPTAACTDPDLCEKPYTTGHLATILGVIIGILFAAVLCVLVYLHNRKTKEVNMEDEHHKSLDFGVEGMKRKSRLGLDKGAVRHKSQLSMDMSLESPYLLPPELHSSRESLARTLNTKEDPYRHVAQYAGSDMSSIRSMSQGPGGRRQSIARSVTGSIVPHHSSAPKSSLKPVSPSPVHLRGERLFDNEKLAASSISDMKAVIVEPITPKIESVDALGEPEGKSPTTTVPSITKELEDEEHLRGDNLHFPGLPAATPGPADSAIDVTTPGQNQGRKEELSFGHMPEPSGVGLGLLDQPRPYWQPSLHVDTTVGVALTAPTIEEPEEEQFVVGDYLDTPDSEKEADGKQHPDHAQEGKKEEGQHGRNVRQTSHPGVAGLGIPQKESRRLSAGFRPLPPGEILDSEDPEYRANRIRSFYKEYFDENGGRADPNAPPMPALPNNRKFPPRQPQKAPPRQGGGGHYYGDMDPAYSEHGAYFDPDGKNFVMPYAQPVTRRAMTPPPSSQRRPFPGGPGKLGGRPTGPGRPPHGRVPSPASLGGRPGPRGPPSSSRSGSGASGMYSPRPGSSISAQAYGRARAASAMSGPRRPMPPPAALPTLPTPSQLRDDSFALFNAADFAPPESFAERARGRSQSPMGERKPYKPAVPAVSLLVTAFDELAALPSPHLLRKSGTFTGLDFAPPRKFGDGDARSETGSIRSNRSGISQAQQVAIRNGAGRVSRLPGDQVFTTAAMSDTLKPQWGMRP